jgi:hypothetical protein
MADIDRTLFDKLADEFIDAGEVQPGTMMGFPCLRVRGNYIACKDKSSGTLIVKLTEKRVNNLVDSGQANEFAPAGRLFNNWAAMSVSDEILWRGVLKEARKLTEDSQG